MRRATALVLACVCTLTFGIVGAPVPVTASGTVSGVVTATDGTPIPGASLLALRDFGGGAFQIEHAVADGEGRYAFPGLSDGSWVIGAGGPGFAIRLGNAATLEEATHVDVSGSAATFDVVLPTTTATIAGTVTDPDGAPIEGVAVHIMVSPTATPISPLFFVTQLGADLTAYQRFVETDADGRYRVDGLAPGAFSVGFSPFSAFGLPTPSRFVGETWPDSHEPGGGEPVTTEEGRETSGIDAALDVGGVIHGRVLDGHGMPVGGASVYTESIIADFGGPLVVTTGVDGSYELIGLSPVDQWVVASDDSRTAFYGGAANASEATRLPVRLGSVFDGIDIVLPDLGTFFATVRTSDGRLAPNAGIVVCLAPGEPTTIPSTFPGFPPTVGCTSGAVSTGVADGGLTAPVGTYRIAAQLGAGVFGTTTVELSATATVTLTNDTPLDCEFVLGGPASCAPTDPSTLDGDGVAASVEDAAPNGGDGNADGVRDATQPNVTSVPFAIDDGYATFVVGAPLTITQARITEPVNLVYGAETGEIGLSVGGLELGATADITILRTSAGLAGDLTAAPSTFGGPRRRVPADFDGTTIVAHVLDGGPFDVGFSPLGPSPADGAVRMFAVPSILDDVPPVITCPSPTPEFTQGVFATMSATVTDDLSGVAGPSVITQTANTFVVGPGSLPFNARDVAGNVSSVGCSYTVVARPADTTPPTIICRPDLAFAQGTENAVVDAFADDDRGLATPWYMSTVVDTTVLGEFTASFTAVDLAGNSTTTGCAYRVVPPPDRVPPVITCGEPTTFLLGDRFARVDATAIDETAPSTPWTVIADVDTGAEGSFEAALSATDAAGNTSTVACAYVVVPDYDGVPSVVEDGAPNGGDGNADGVADRLQSDVASLPDPTGAGYATVYSFNHQWMSAVTASDVAGVPAPPAGTELVGGLYEVTVDSNVAMPRLLLSGGPAFDGLLALADEWLPMPTFVVDGDRADLDGPANGRVTVRFAAALLDRTPPTITCASTPSFLLHQPGARVVATVSDAGSGVADPTITVDVATDHPGDQQVAVFASDLAENSASTVCDYRVGVRLVRLVAPPRAQMAEIAPNRVLAVRWRATDWYGRGVIDPAHFVGVSASSTRCTAKPVADAARTTIGLRDLGGGRWEYGARMPSRRGCALVTLELTGASAAVTVRIR